ncbi:lipase family protein [Gordonia sp. ABSL1-1]|uniref:lipase family protein n=1 Tax=Gordonia sp. ABSL1-1 TaxID=3053923 RepID=UPI002573215A|nr:lipase family protein [Gordonia sp. ABSL1-1]MDL9937607.1 lipase family protein [Gordonia sp. ABSL1-1]
MLGAGFIIALPLVAGGIADAAPAHRTPQATHAQYDQVTVRPVTGLPVPPEMDPGFYDPPRSVIATKMTGQIIAARRVTIANLSLIPVPVDAWQLSFRSSDTRGNPIAAVTTVLRPRSNKTPDGKPRRLLAFDSAADSLARYCEPSYQYQLGSVPYQITGSSVVGNEILQVQAALAQGWAVVVPDAQGPKSAYAAGPLQARITLDAIRAAQRFAPMGLDQRTRVGVAGYSGGAIASNWVAEIADSYAPEIDLVGVSSGGSQPNLASTLNMAEGQATAGLVLAAVIGLSREYPELKDYVDTHVTPEGRALLNAKQNLCVTYTTLLVPFLHNKAVLRGGDPLRAPQVRRVIEKTRMGKTTPTVPLLQLHSRYDWIAPLPQVDKLVATYCRNGANVTYIRDHASEHLILAVASTPVWMMWLRDRFNGVPIHAGCTTKDVNSVALDQRTWPVWVDTVGDLLAGVFQRPLGVR